MKDLGARKNMPIVSTSQLGLFLFRKLALELELENAPSYIHGLEAEARRLAKFAKAFRGEL